MKGKIVTLLLAGMLLALAVQAQMESASLTDAERNGEIMFRQRCSVCHLFLQSNGKPYGPVLNADSVPPDAAAYEIIGKGTPRMPGFQYGLESKEIYNIIAYLRTVKNIAPNKPRD